MQVFVRVLALVSFAFPALSSGDAFAQANFYEGKSICMIVGFSAGGGYEKAERILLI